MRNPPLPSSLGEFFETSSVALSLARPGDDHALVFVNAKFSELTGYFPHEMIGRNCRLLQRDVDDRQARAKVRAFLQGRRSQPVRTPIVNFRKDGTPFVNLLHLSRLRGRSGETLYILGSQFDISRALPERLVAHDRQLAQTLTAFGPATAEHGIDADRAMITLADAVSLIAQAKLTLDSVESD